MRIYDLSGHPSCPCFILKHGGATIMMDCGLDLSSTLCYLPVSILPNENKNDVKDMPKCIKEINGVHFIDDEPRFIIPETNLLDMSRIDVVLISNYNCALGLPYVTEYTNFRGVVYATEPTLNFAKLLMEELVMNVSKVPSSEKPSASPLAMLDSSTPKSIQDPEILELFRTRIYDLNMLKDWRRLYSAFDVKSCLSKFQVLGLNEIKEIPGGLCIQPLSSGFGIGSCNWLISSAYRKFAYMSSSSVLKTHAKPIEKTPLKSCDLLILSCLSQRPLTSPSNYVLEFCDVTVKTLKNGGNVLVPCCTVGALYDLIECLHQHLESAGLGGTPLYCLSPAANSSLAFSSIYSEWLSASKQSKVFLPDSPFPHSELLRTQRLQAFNSIHEGFSKEVSHPCVVFASHTCLRFGDVVHLLHTWNKKAANCVVITDPSLKHTDILAPFKPLIMGVYCFPIDTSLSFCEVDEVLREIEPKAVVLPQAYVSGTQPGTYIEQDLNLLPTTRLEVIQLSMKKEFRKLTIVPELARCLNLVELRPGVGVAMVAGSLTCTDDKYTLKPIMLPSVGKNDGKTGNVLKPKLAYGSLNSTEFVRRLRQKDFSVRNEDFGNGNFLIELPDYECLVQVENGSTHIICNDEKVRQVIRDTLIECLSVIT